MIAQEQKAGALVFWWDFFVFLNALLEEMIAKIPFAIASNFAGCLQRPVNSAA